MINVHRVTELEIERSQEWTTLKVVTNDTEPSDYSLAKQIADTHPLIYASDLLDIIKEYFKNEQQTMEITLFHKDNIRFPILTTERDDA